MKVSLRKIRLDRGGYEIGSGCYYGIGQPVWKADAENGQFFIDFRAPDREAAKQFVRDRVPTATFYR